MNPVTKAAVALGAVLVLCLVAWVPLRGMLQFRAEYPGGLTFIGHADGLLGTEYYRVYMWRSPEDDSPLPDVTLHLRGKPYRLSDLTSELMQSLGGTPGDGGIKDSADDYFVYRFEDGRLTFFSLQPSRPEAFRTAHENQADRFQLRGSEGRPFLLPASQAELSALMGPPRRITRNIAN